MRKTNVLFVIKCSIISHCAAALETDKTIVVLLVDLRRESECNRVENYVAIEATEVGRQRAEVAQWTFERIKNSLNNRQTLLSGNSSFFRASTGAPLGWVRWVLVQGPIRNSKPWVLEIIFLVKVLILTLNFSF